MPKSKKPLLFWTARYAYLAEAMLKSGLFTAGRLYRSILKDGTPSLEDKPFADGERYYRLGTDVDCRPVVLLGGTVDDRETMELFDIGNLLVDMGASELKVLIPYYGYSTMERAVNPGEAVMAKHRARLLSAIPQSRLGNSIYMVDLHAIGMQHYFEGATHPRHIYAKPLVIAAVRDLLLARGGISAANLETADKKAVKAALAQPFVFASTDVGRSAWVDSLTRDMVAEGLNASPAFIIKRRTGADSSEVRDISADVQGAFVIIYDDIVRTAGSLIKAAKSYRAKGAADVAAILTHCVLPGDSKKILTETQLFWKVVVTDTHLRATALQDDFLIVKPIAGLLSEQVIKGRLDLV